MKRLFVFLCQSLIKRSSTEDIFTRLSSLLESLVRFYQSDQLLFILSTSYLGHAKFCYTRTQYHHDALKVAILICLQPIFYSLKKTLNAKSLINVQHYTGRLAYCPLKVILYRIGNVLRSMADGLKLPVLAIDSGIREASMLYRRQQLHPQAMTGKNPGYCEILSQLHRTMRLMIDYISSSTIIKKTSLICCCISEKLRSGVLDMFSIVCQNNSVITAFLNLNITTTHTNI